MNNSTSNDKKNNENRFLRQVILDNYKNPQNRGTPNMYDRTAFSANRSCGDEITVFLKIKDDKIAQINYEIRGCALSTASASILSEELKGETLNEILELDESFVQDLLGTELSINRVKCGMLPLEAIQKAIDEN
jgi:nitrogen fixation NifU-like protein